MTVDLLRKKHSKYHTPIFFAIFVVVLLLTFFMVKSYIGLIFLSFVYSIVVWPLYQKLLKFIAKPAWIATPLAIIISLLVIVLPSIVFIRILLTQVLEAVSFIQRSYSQEDFYQLATQINDFLTRIPFLNSQLDQQWLTSTLTDLFVPLRNFLVSSLWVIGNSSVDFLINFILLSILNYFIF